MSDIMLFDIEAYSLEDLKKKMIKKHKELQNQKKNNQASRLMGVPKAVFNEEEKRKELEEFEYEDLCKCARVSIMMAVEAKASRDRLIFLILEKEREVWRKALSNISKRKKGKGPSQGRVKKSMTTVINEKPEKIIRYKETKQFVKLTEEQSGHLDFIDSSDHHE